MKYVIYPSAKLASSTHHVQVYISFTYLTKKKKKKLYLTKLTWTNKKLRKLKIMTRNY